MLQNIYSRNRARLTRLRFKAFGHRNAQALALYSVVHRLRVVLMGSFTALAWCGVMQSSNRVRERMMYINNEDRELNLQSMNLLLMYVNKKGTYKYHDSWKGDILLSYILLYI